MNSLLQAWILTIPQLSGAFTDPQIGLHVLHSEFYKLPLHLSQYPKIFLFMSKSSHYTKFFMALDSE